MYLGLNMQAPPGDITIRVPPAFALAAGPAEAAAKEWSARLGRKIVVEPNSTCDPKDPRCIGFMADHGTLPNDPPGCASLKTASPDSTGAWTAGTAIRFIPNWNPQPPAGPPHADNLRHTIAHELGHYLTFMVITRLAWIAPVLALAATAIAGTQTIPELARARPQNPIVRGVMRDIFPQSIAKLTKGADLVVDAMLSHENSYLTPDEEHILTDFQINVNRVLAARDTVGKPTPSPAAQALTLTVTGGKYTVDGFTVYEVDHNLDTPKVGGRYLLFLKPFGTKPGQYQTYSGGAFEIDGQRLRALLKRSEEAYKEVSAKPIEELVLEIQRVAAKPEPQ